MLHQCNQCDYSSKVKCNVLRHMRSQHQNQQNVSQAIKEQSTQIQSGSGSVVTSTTHIPLKNIMKRLI